MRQLWLALFALWLVIPGAGPAFAHQQKITISTVEHNPRTGLLEVIHRVPLHDAEHALERQGERAPDIIANTQSRRAFAVYVAERFSIAVDGKTLDLVVLGSEIDGGNLLVYQETPSPGIGAEIQVRSQILSDVWARQVNRVNLGKADGVETLIFRPGDPAKSGSLR